jgi:hypothetical protein
MKRKRQIGWQKYEDVIKDQINAPILKEIIQEIKQNSAVPIEDDIEDEYELEGGEIVQSVMVSLPESVISEAALTTAFDCWIGHANFNITEDIKDTVDEVEGVEMLKIYSRYRFFVGIGKMFDFKQVRKDIEASIL